MKALSIRQPWAWLIVHGGKDIENRSWHTKFRGRFLVHAAKGMTSDEFTQALLYCVDHGLTLPDRNDMQHGGIIGSVELVDSLDTSSSPWYKHTEPRSEHTSATSWLAKSAEAKDPPQRVTARCTS